MGANMRISEFWDPWADSHFLMSYEREIEDTLKEAWVAEEIEDGTSMDKILDIIWDKYEDWAFNQRYEETNYYL